jgi:uncharacterized membrane protein (DUF2068 family)
MACAQCAMGREAVSVRVTLTCCPFMRPSESKPDPHPGQRHVLRAVAAFEFSKGIFVVLMGFCALALVHKDVWVIAESLLALFHISTDRHSAQVFLDFADNVTDARLWAAARIAFTYAALRFIEAYGLWLARTWAEWVAFVSGTLLLPLEIRELFRGLTLLRCGLLLGNLAVVAYMLWVIFANRRERRNGAWLGSAPKTPARSRN